jgi:hypothetical protein
MKITTLLSSSAALAFAAFLATLFAPVSASVAYSAFAALVIAMIVSRDYSSRSGYVVTAAVRTATAKPRSAFPRVRLQRRFSAPSAVLAK